MSFGTILSQLIGWTYTAAWTLSFYPQFLLNWRRRSVQGLSIDFIYLNPVGFLSYSASIIGLSTSSAVRKEYRHRHNGSNPQVQWNDIAFAVHAFILSSSTLVQTLVYKRDPGQRSSIYTRIFIVSSSVVVAAASILASAGSRSQIAIPWLDVVYLLSYLKLFISFAKYLPQLILNFQRKSTVGWSIENILLDLTGGNLSLGQLVLDSWLSDDWSGITGNPGKLGLSLFSIGFDVLFVLQHFVWYRTGSVTLSLFEDTTSSNPSQAPAGNSQDPNPNERTRLLDDALP
ncbi:PQ-loop-domain-containing protein [Meredithblackwellia eburnea MCA 4105]